MNKIKHYIQKFKMMDIFIQRIRQNSLNRSGTFSGSRDYWIQRYKSGGHSGPGSYNKLAEFKAEVVNGFVRKNNIATVMDFGCGDGNQLKLANYPAYIGFDVSPKIISCVRICSQKTNRKILN